MKRLLSSLSYQSLRDGALYRLTGIFIVAMAVFGIVIGIASDETPCAGRLIADAPSVLWLFQYLIIAIVVGTVSAGDFKDKDLYYEIMSGHSRVDIFLSRAIPSTVLSALLAVLLSAVPVISNCIVFGWGDVIEVKGAVIRIALCFFPFLRLASFYTLTAFLSKNRMVVTALGYMAMICCIFLQNVITGSQSAFLLSSFNLQKLMDYGTWSIYNLDPTGGIVMYTAYDSSISKSMAAGTIMISVLVSAVYLLAGYGFFCKNDLD